MNTRLHIIARLVLLVPSLAVSGAAISGAGCSTEQCEAFKSAVNATAAGINGVIGAVEAWENAASAGPTSCADTAGGPDEGTASFEGGSIKVCDMSGTCGTTPASSLCEPKPKDTSCNSCTKSKCCADVPAFTGEIVAGCLVACQSGLKDCGGTDLATATAYCHGGTDAAYNAMGACIADNCSSECSAFVFN